VTVREAGYQAGDRVVDVRATIARQLCRAALLMWRDSPLLQQPCAAMAAACVCISGLCRNR
jgi:hypothetical protein